MQIRALYLLAATAACVAAIPATTPAAQSHKSVVETVSAAPHKAKHHGAGKPKTSGTKTVKTANVDLQQCGSCFEAVTQTISSCEPVLDGFSGWFHIPGCISQIVGDFSALQDDCIPCLQSFIN